MFHRVSGLLARFLARAPAQPRILDALFVRTATWPDDTLILRVGVSAIETLRRVKPDPHFPDRLVFSVQAHPGVDALRLLLDNDEQPLFGRGKYRTTTLGEVRTVAADRDQCLAEIPIPGNDYHCVVVGLTPEAFERILTRPPERNPLPRHELGNLERG